MDIQKSLAAADFTGIDLLIGTNKDEVKYWKVDLKTEDAYNDMIMLTTNSLREEFEDADKPRLEPVMP